MHIEFTEGEDKITLEGPTKDVQMVQSQIETIVIDLVSIYIFFSNSTEPKVWMQKKKKVMGYLMAM